MLLPRALPAYAALAAGIAFSRVYVGVHYPGDVVVGLAVGAVFGLMLIAVAEGPRRTFGREDRVRRRRLGGRRRRGP